MNNTKIALQLTAYNVDIENCTKEEVYELYKYFLDNLNKVYPNNNY